jgi:hypothetical protein
MQKGSQGCLVAGDLKEHPWITNEPRCVFVRVLKSWPRCGDQEFVFFF